MQGKAGERRQGAGGGRGGEGGRQSEVNSALASGWRLSISAASETLINRRQEAEGSVSLSAAVIPHSDEHLKCQDPFQQLRAGNQALRSPPRAAPAPRTDFQAARAETGRLRAHKQGSRAGGSLQQPVGRAAWGQADREAEKGHPGAGRQREAYLG